MNEIEVVRHPQIPGLSIFLDTVEYRTPHLHKELELVWILAGEMSIQGGPPVQPGDLAVINPKQTHTFRTGERACTFLCVQIAPQFFSGSVPAAAGLRFDTLSVSSVLPPEILSDLLAMLKEATLAYFRQEPEYELLCTGLLHLILRLLLRHVPHHILTEAEELEQERRAQRLDRLIDFVDREHKHKIRLSDFARREGRSMSYLSHFVRENLGQSFQDYVTAVRFQTACALIAAGRDRLLDICTESGFSDYRYFSRAFRQRLGMTPEEYRTAQRGQARPDRPRVPSGQSLERFYSREESLQIFTALSLSKSSF